MSKTTKQVIWGTIGIFYAFVYGLWTIMATGGGHGDFIWFWLFLTVEFLGLYFPLMAVLAVDLRERATNIAFAVLIGFNLIASSVMLIGWTMESGGGKPSDYQKIVQINGIQGVIFCAALHFLPTLFFAALLIKAIIYGAVPPDEDAVLRINLQDD